MQGHQQLIMKLAQTQPLTPQQRAAQLGVDPANFPRPVMNEETEAAVNFIKRKDRSNLKLQEWNRKEYWHSDATKLLFECQQQIQRRNMSDLSLEEFTERYEKTCTPVIIKGCSQGWQQHKWTHSYFLEQYGMAKFKVGEDDDGYKLRLSYRQYLEYLLYNQDDSPLYLFQSSLEDKEETAPIIDNYQVPPYFKDDLFHLAGERRRPPYRWLIMGAQRSGTTVHTDPLMTSAWNASLRGHKRWVLFGAGVPKSIVKGRQFRDRHYDDEAINYFVEILPKIKQKYSRESLQLIEFIQGPGETVFVPGGLWHAVVNLDDTIAVTQNVMTHYCFDKVWRVTRTERRKFAQNFLHDLMQKAPQLFERAIALNQQDRYEMGNKYCQQEVSLSFTPSSSSSDSSSSQEQSSSSEEQKACGNRVNVHHRPSQMSSRSSSSPSRSREKKKSRVTLSEEKRPLQKRRLSLTDF